MSDERKKKTALYAALAVFAVIIIWLLMRKGETTQITQQRLGDQNFTFPDLYGIPPLSLPTIGERPYISGSNCGCQSCYSKPSVNVPAPPRSGVLVLPEIVRRTVQVGRYVQPPRPRGHITVRRR